MNGWGWVEATFAVGLTAGAAVVALVGGPASTAEASNALPYYAEASFTPHWFASPDDVPADFHGVRDFALVDQLGRSVTRGDIDGKITIANFFFTWCPGICPMTMANMSRLQEEFANDAGVLLMSHSVTPDADSVAALQAYAEQMNVVSDSWLLLTGSRDEIYDLGKNAYFADEDLGEAVEVGEEVDGAFLHTESFFLVDGEGRIRGIYNGMNKTAVAQLIEDVHTLRAEVVRNEGQLLTEGVP